MASTDTRDNHLRPEEPSPRNSQDPAKIQNTQIPRPVVEDPSLREGGSAQEGGEEGKAFPQMLTLTVLCTFLQKTAATLELNVRRHRGPPFRKHLQLFSASALVWGHHSTLGMKGHVSECQAGPSLLLWTGQHLNDSFRGGTRSFSQCLPVQLEHLYATLECWVSANCYNEAISLQGWAVLNKQEQQGRVHHWAICGSTLAKSAAVFTAPVAVGRTEMAAT